MKFWSSILNLRLSRWCQKSIFTFYDRPYRAPNMLYEKILLSWMYWSFHMLSEMNYLWSYGCQYFCLVWGDLGVAWQYVDLTWVLSRFWWILECRKGLHSMQTIHLYIMDILPHRLNPVNFNEFSLIRKNSVTSTVTHI